MIHETQNQGMELAEQGERRVTIFHSNYSANCKALRQFITNTFVMDRLNIKFINIDNNAIKKIILKKFSVVPAMVVMYIDEISLYTGDNVFEWFINEENTTRKPSLQQPSQRPLMSKAPEAATPGLHASTERSERGNPEPSEDQKDESKKSIMEIAEELSKARESHAFQTTTTQN